jgi:hypothetical protein
MVTHPKQDHKSDRSILSDIIRDLTEHLLDRYSFPSEDDAYLVAVWIVHTWLIAGYDKTVYLLVTAPHMDYGKTEIAKALRDLCPGARLVTHPTASSLTKFSPDGTATLIIDEFDKTLRRNETDKQILYQFANAGIDRAYDGYMVSGDDGNVEFRSTFGPKAFVGIHIKDMEGTLLSRTIRIRTRKGNGVDQTERRNRQTLRPVSDTAKAIKQRLEDYATDDIIDMVKTMIQPNNLNAASTIADNHILVNRDSDNWVPLIIVGDISGPADGKRIRDIASRYTSGNMTDDPEVYDSEAEQIDAAFMRLFRSGRIPVRNYANPKHPPIPAHSAIRVTNEDFGWNFRNRRPPNVLPAITLLVNEDTKQAEIRIKSSDLTEIASVLGWSPTEIKRAYKDSNRLHHEKGRLDIKLAMFSNATPKDNVRMIAIDYSNVIFGIDSGLKAVNRILTANSESEIWNADQ